MVNTLEVDQLSALPTVAIATPFKHSLDHNSSTINQHTTITITMLSQHQSNSINMLLDQLQTMQLQEETFYKSSDYLSELSTSASSYRSHSSEQVTHADRSSMITWSYQIVDCCRISRSIALSAASLFDRFMSKQSLRAGLAMHSKYDFQLIFITCLIIALKARAGMVVESDFVSATMCQGLYQQDEIVSMEMEILEVLGWRVNGPSIHEFIHLYLELLPEDVKSSKTIAMLTNLATAMAEQATLDYPMALQAPSTIAMACILSSMQWLELHPLERIALLHMMTRVNVNENVHHVRARLEHVEQRQCLEASSSTARDTAVLLCTLIRAMEAGAVVVVEQTPKVS